MTRRHWRGLCLSSSQQAGGGDRYDVGINELYFPSCVSWQKLGALSVFYSNNDDVTENSN